MTRETRRRRGAGFCIGVDVGGTKSLVAETATCLAAKGGVPPTFVSPNVPGVDRDHMNRVYQAFTEFYFARPMKAEP